MRHAQRAARTPQQRRAHLGLQAGQGSRDPGLRDAHEFADLAARH